MNLERSYVRELNHNYMIVIPETDTIIESFEIEMIGQNQIQGLLEFEIRYVDGKQTFLYEISSKQSITNLYASSEMNFEMITGLIQATYQMIYTVEEYLLDMNHILIDPEYLFFDIEKREYFFVFFPEKIQDAKAGFIKLSEYILDKVDHRDEKAVLLTYRIYKNTRVQNFKIEEIISYLQECTEIPGTFVDKNIKRNVIETNDPQINDFMTDAQMGVMYSNDNMSENLMKSNELNATQNKFSEKDYPSQKQEKSFFLGVTDKIFSQPNRIYIIVILIIMFGFLLIGAGWYLKIIHMSTIWMIKIEGLLLLLLILSVLMFEIKLGRKNRKSVEEHCDITKMRMDEEEFKEERIEDNVEIRDFLSDHDYYKETHNIYENTMLVSFEKEDCLKEVLTGIVDGKDENVELNVLPFTIGKLSGNVNLALKDHSISRIHARFYKKDEQLYLEDLNSLNGTFKNGVRLNRNEAVPVQKNDEIEFAKIKFTYH